MKGYQYAVLTLVCAVFITACAVTPTGRKQLTIMPESQLVVMGVQSFHEIQNTTPVLNDKATNAYVQCVASAITPTTGPVTSALILLLFSAMTEAGAEN